VDYVVFGIGFGATLVLLGWALRTFGPGLRYRPPDGADAVLSGADLLGKLSWTRFVSALGAVVATGGTAMLIGTVITILMTPRDRVGTIVVLSCFLLILIVACIWAWMYIGRYGTHGILPERTAPAAPLRTPREAGAEVQPRRSGEPVAAAQPVQGPPVVPLDQPAGPTPGTEPVAAVMGPPLVDDLPESAGIGGGEAAGDLVADAPTPRAAEQGTAIAETDASAMPADEQETGDVSEPVESSDIVVDDSGDESSAIDAPPGPETGDVAQSADQAAAGDDSVEGERAQFVDVLPRTSTSPEESGRAEALRNLRARRSSRMSSDQS
jgi:hypothetical protein